MARNIQRLGAILCANKHNKQRIDDEALTKKPLKHTADAEKSSNHGKGVSKIRLEWLICIIESGQKKKRTHLHRKRLEL